MQQKTIQEQKKLLVNEVEQLILNAEEDSLTYSVLEHARKLLFEISLMAPIQYDLTDMPKEELKLFAEMIHYRLAHEEQRAIINEELPASTDHIEAKKRVREDLNATIKRLRDMNVRVLTSLQIVKEKEIVTSN